MADVYAAPTLGELAAAMDEKDAAPIKVNRRVRPVPVKTQIGQLLASIPLRALSGLRHLTWMAAANNLAASWFDLSFLPTLSWWWVAAGWLLFITPVGRIIITATGVRLVLAGVQPGEYPRGGKIHLRVWLAERLADEMGAMSLSSAPFTRLYARALGATVGKDVDLHSIHPSPACSRWATDAPWSRRWTSAVTGSTATASTWAGSRSASELGSAPARHWSVARRWVRTRRLPQARQSSTQCRRASSGLARRQYARPSPAEDRVRTETPRNRPVWLIAYGASSIAISLLPVAAVLTGLLAAWPALSDTETIASATRAALIWLPVATVVGMVALAILVLLAARLFGTGLKSGFYPVHGRQAWQAWSTLRLLDEARTWLFPLYASTLTPSWLRLLGARIGKNVEASTVLLIPKLSEVRDGAFLADDTLLGGYELGGGWLRIDEVRVGKHAFVGNSGMAAPGRRVPKQGLVAVLSAAPRRSIATAGSSWIGSPPTKLRRRPASRTRAERTSRPAGCGPSERWLSCVDCSP